MMPRRRVSSQQSDLPPDTPVKNAKLFLACADRA